MTGPSVSREEQNENSVKAAFDKAAALLAKADRDEVCRITGARFRDGCFEVELLGRTRRYEVASGSFLGNDLPLIAQVLILHYLTGKGGDHMGKFVNFSSLPGGMFYFESFKRRVIDKLIRTFGESADLLLPAAEKVGGKKWDEGSGVIIPLFPKIDTVFQIYPEDDEFPASANVLYSSTVTGFLPIEDIAFAGGFIASALG